MTSQHIYRADSLKIIFSSPESLTDEVGEYPGFRGSLNCFYFSFVFIERQKNTINTKEK